MNGRQLIKVEAERAITGAMNAPVSIAQFASDVDPRSAFLARAAALDTLVQAAEIDLGAAFDELVDPFLEIVGPDAKTCNVCGRPPWRHNDSFCRACREANQHRQHAQPKRHRPTPETTIEAILYGVRQRGIGALTEPDNIERLSRCDERARSDVNRRIAAITARKELAA
jgi:hypothetical protein